jgi:hypothetical protein
LHPNPSYLIRPTFAKKREKVFENRKYVKEEVELGKKTKKRKVTEKSHTIKFHKLSKKRNR